MSLTLSERRRLRYHKRRRALIRKLGKRCQDCRESRYAYLEFDHNTPRVWIARKLNRWHRLAWYAREAAEGKVTLRCSTCNKKKGTPKPTPAMAQEDEKKTPRVDDDITKGQSMGFAPATREKTHLKAAIAGPSGAGKSFTWLTLAHAMKARGLCRRIGVICTEGGKIKKYAGYVVDGVRWEFGVEVLTSFSPADYIAKLEMAMREGVDLVIIDGLSAEWQGTGGVLEIADRASEATRNKFAGWKAATPQHNRFINTILNVPLHILATVRSKMGYVQVEEQRNGKTVCVPRRIGLEPIQRNGIEYEFEVFGEIDESHALRISKTICPAIDGAIGVKPGAEFFAPLIDWLAEGADVQVATYQPQLVSPADLTAALTRLAHAGVNLDLAKAWALQMFGARELSAMTGEQFELFRAWVDVSTESHRQRLAKAAATLSKSTAAASHGDAYEGSSVALASADCLQLWEMYAHYMGWSRPDTDANFKAAILDRFGVAEYKELAADQLVTLHDALVGAVEKARAAKRDLEASKTPF